VTEHGDSVSFSFLADFGRIVCAVQLTRPADYPVGALCLCNPPEFSVIVKLYMMILCTWPSGIPSGGSLRGLSSTVIHRRLKNSFTHASFLFCFRISLSLSTLDLPEGGEGGRGPLCVPQRLFFCWIWNYKRFMLLEECLKDYVLKSKIIRRPSW